MKKTIIAASLVFALCGGVAHASTSPAFKFNSIDEVHNAFVKLVNKYPRQQKTLLDIESAFKNPRVSDAAIKKKMIIAGVIFKLKEPKLCDEVINTFGLSTDGYRHILNIVRA